MPKKTPPRKSFIRRFEYMLASPAYRDLSTRARCLMEEFQRIYRPGRNGKLSMSVQNGARLLNCSPNTARTAYRELEEHGFLSLCCEASYTVGKATEYRLTFERHNSREPTDEWRDWEPGKPLLCLGRRRRKKQIDTAKSEQDLRNNSATPPQNLRMVVDNEQ